MGYVVAAKKKAKIVSIAGEQITSDIDRMAALRDCMTPSDRDTYDKILKAIDTAFETTRMSIMPAMLRHKEEIERRYEQGNEDRITVTWDDVAIAGA